MPNRIIRESARTSATLYQLSHGAERMFWRLITVADDYGRFEADLRILRAMCFPLWGDRIKVPEIGRWYQEMEKAGLVQTYVVNHKILGHFPTWERHNRRRAQTPKFPPPSSDNMCQHPLTHVAESSIREARSETRKSDANGSGAEAPSPGVHEAEQLGLGNGASPTAPTFRLPSAIVSALDRAPILGAVPRLRESAFWQATIRANPGVDFPREVLKAEQWLVTHPERTPKKPPGLVRYLSGWMGRADRDEQ